MDKNKIKFDILKIDALIKKGKAYEEEDIQFEFCNEYNNNQSERDEKVDYPKYIAKINSKFCNYVGILSNNLRKESYGYNCHENEDEYFGQWNKDQKEGYGIYYFKDQKIENEDSIKQIYAGEFKNNQKSGEGIYFRITRIETEGDNFIPVDFSLAIGNFLEDFFVKGVIFSIKDEKRKIYKGKINKDGKKNDDKAEYYEDDEKVFKGKFWENDMIEGRIVLIKDSKKEKGYYFTKNEENNIEFEYNKDEKIDEQLIKQSKELYDIFQYDKVKELFITIMNIKNQLNSKKNFDYIKNINFDMDIKQNLKELYGKWLYC